MVSHKSIISSIPVMIHLEDAVHIWGGKSTIDRFWEKIARQEEADCWMWLGAKLPSGYGNFHGKKGSGIWYAHQFSYLLAHGELDRRLTIDHLCRIPLCVNDGHLEQVPLLENIRRGSKAQQTHCIRGHLFDKENTYIAANGTRKCRRCLADFQKRYRKTEAWRQWNAQYRH